LSNSHCETVLLDAVRTVAFPNVLFASATEHESGRSNSTPPLVVQQRILSESVSNKTNAITIRGSATIPDAATISRANMASMRAQI